MYSKLFKNFQINSKPVLLFSIALLFVSLFACRSLEKRDFEAKAVARVFDSYLYSSDIENIVPDGTNLTDSSRMVRQYIKSWISQQLILDKAKFNLSDKQSYTSIEKQLEDYRTSLIIYAYQKELIKQKLDTVISEADIQKYYDENKANLILEDNILKAK